MFFCTLVDVLSPVFRHLHHTFDEESQCFKTCISHACHSLGALPNHYDSVMEEHSICVLLMGLVKAIKYDINKQGLTKVTSYPVKYLNI